MFHPPYSQFNFLTPDQYRNVLIFKIQKRRGKLLTLAHIMYVLSFILPSKREDTYHGQEIGNILWGYSLPHSRYPGTHTVSLSWWVFSYIWYQKRFFTWVTTAVAEYFSQGVICCSKKWTELTLLSIYCLVEWQIKGKFDQTTWREFENRLEIGSAPGRRATTANEGSEWGLGQSSEQLRKHWNTAASGEQAC